MISSQSRYSRRAQVIPALASSAAFAARAGVRTTVRLVPSQRKRRGARRANLAVWRTGQASPTFTSTKPSMPRTWAMSQGEEAKATAPLQQGPVQIRTYRRVQDEQHAADGERNSPPGGPSPVAPYPGPSQRSSGLSITRRG